MKGLKATATTYDWQQNLGKTLAGLLSGSASTLLDSLQAKETPESITGDWQKLYATPAMNMWKETIAPLIKESYNLPGSLYSRSSSLGIANEASKFYNQNVTPTLFNALEGFRSRQVQMSQIYANVLGIGSGLSTAQTIQSVNDQGDSWYEAMGKQFDTYSSMAGDVAGIISSI